MKPWPGYAEKEALKERSAANALRFALIQKDMLAVDPPDEITDKEYFQGGI